MWKVLLCACLLASGSISSTVFIDGPTSASNKKDGLIVHEWGTFTTFSGSNGVHLDFRPLQDDDLPGFVLNRAEQSGHVWFGKGRIRTRVRMETPVTYFYTDTERTVRVSVDFPQGLLTEFYPPVAAMSPPFNADLAIGGDGEPVGHSTLDWGHIDLIPLSHLRPAIKDDLTAEWLRQRFLESILPPAGDNHYQHARNTDSALVHVRHQAPAQSNETAAGSAQLFPGDFIEKFLFYRGVGKFDVPVSVVTSKNGELLVSNRGQGSLNRMILLRVNGESLTYSIIPDVATGQTIRTTAPSTRIELEELREITIQELTSAGLYVKEAQAMVDTWTTSWFTEEGTRLFYFVPQQLTDTLLPLHITPTPYETLRVMVGRVEIMSASQEARLLTVVKRSATERARLYREQAETGLAGPTEMPVPPEFAELGRLAEPALARIREISSDRVVQDEADFLIAQLRADLAEAEQQQQESAQAAR